MSRISELIIENFKSYGGRQVIGPFKTFTSIVGPNGAGKSNLMDAISFVLGVRSAQLRGKQYADLIHRSDAHGTAKSAFVEVVYREADGRETRFRRAIDHKKAAYLVDGKEVSLSEYEKALRKIGVLVRARNFLVFQGDVESIAAKSPKELTELIEEVSGSAELRKQFEDLKEKAAEAEDEFLRLFEKRRNVNKETKQMKLQKEEAERFQELIDEQKSLKLEYFLWQLFHTEKDLETYTEEHELLNKELAARRGESDKLEKKLQDKAKEKAAQSRMLLKIEKGINEQNKELDKLRPQSIKLREQIDFSKREITSSEAKLTKMQTQTSQHDNLLKTLEKELKGVETALSDHQRLAEREDSEGRELKLAASQLNEYNRIKAEAGVTTGQWRLELEQLKGAARIEKDTCAHLDSHIATLSDRLEELKKEQDELHHRREKSQNMIGDVKGKLDSERKALKEARAQMSQSEAKQKEVTDALNEASNRLQELKADRRESEHDKKMNDALQALKAHFPGVRDRVYELCKPIQEKYRLALTIAMGKNMEAIVVDDQKTAMECIKYMKEQQVGVATFLPLDSLSVKEVNDSLRRLGGSFRPVFDVIQFDESVIKAMLYVCGSTLVCDSLDEARALCYGSRAAENRYKVVTLDGSVIHKSGNMSGGQGAHHSKAHKWNDKAYQKALQTRDELYQKMVDMNQHRITQDTLTKLEVSITGLGTRLKYAEVDLKTVDKKTEQNAKEMEALSKEIESKKKELAKAQKAMEAKRSEQEALELRISQREDELFAAFSASVGVRNIREYEQQRLAVAKQHMDRQADLNNQLSRIKNQLDYQKRKSPGQALQELKDKLKADRAEQRRLESEQSALEAEIEKRKTRLAESSEEYKQLQAVHSKKQAELTELKRQVTQLTKELTSLEKQATLKSGQRDQMKETRHELLRRARVEDVAIPFLEGGKRGKGTKRKAAKPKAKKGGKKRRGKHRDDDEEEEDEEEEEEEEEKKEDEDEEMSPADEDESKEKEESLTIDYSALEETLDLEAERALSAADYERSKQDYLSRLAKLSGDMDTLAPNLKAIDQYAEMKARVTEVNENWQEKKRENAETNEAFETKKNERLDKFMRAFKHISAEIDGIYKALTKSPQFPEGGKAYLSLERTDEPFAAGIKYTAMPPMKRFRDMNELSGGEKTVAALALLFAIHSYHPAPFFVLDEVDAALDNVNVTKVSNYIKTRSARDGLQCIVISLKDTFYTKADGLVGIYRDQAAETSRSLTMDLTRYD